MFVLKKRVSSLTYNDEAREAVNLELQKLQEKLGIEFTSVKHLFEHMLSLANSTEAPAKVEETTELPAENMLLLPDTEETKAFTTNMNQLRLNTDALAEDSNMFEVLDFAVKVALFPPEPIETTLEIEKELTDSQYIITLTDQPKAPIEKKKILIDEIAKRRQSKYKFLTIESHSELMEKMIFNEGTIFNLHGEFYTGF